MKSPTKWSRAPRRRRASAVIAALALLGALGLTACQPQPEDIALGLSLTDTGSSAASEANVTVSVFPAEDTAAPATANGVTDESGQAWFTHDELPPGDYVVRYGSGPSTTWWPDASTRAEATSVTVTASGSLDLAGSLEAQVGYVLGKAIDGDGVGIPNVLVTAYDAATGVAVSSTWAVDAGNIGLYLFYATTNGGTPLNLGQNYKFGYSKSGYGTVYAGPGGTTVNSLADAASFAAGSPDQVHVNVSLSAESTISATVTDGTNPIGEVVVGAYVADSNHLAATTLTAADGTFTLHGLNGIGYKLAFIAPGNTYAPMVLGAGTGPGVELDVANGSTFSLQTGGTLSLGTVSLTQGADCVVAQAGAASDLSNADLRNCDLSTADLSAVDLTRANLSGANLSHADLPDAYSIDPDVHLDLSEAKLTGANLSHAQSSSTGFRAASADFTGADLSEANLSRGSMNGSTFVGANLSHTNLNRARLDRATVSGADLSSPTFLYTNTYNLTWTTPPTIPSGYKLVGSHLVGAGVSLLGVDLSGVDLSGMNLTDFHLTSVNLSGANLTSTNLSNILWNEVDLSGTDMTGATLSIWYVGHLTWDAATVPPAGWTIENGTFVPTD